MRIVNGKYNSAKVFTDNVEDTCIEQIQGLLDQEAFGGARVRIMPDCHAGKGCVIGFTADLGDKIIPNVVGVDIGCGMMTLELGKIDIDFERLDRVIRTFVPSGRDVHEGRLMHFDRLQEMHCYRDLKDTRHIQRAIGTLGGGNHFIEVDVDGENNKYLGKQVAKHYQKIASGLHTGKQQMWDEEERIKTQYEGVIE